MTADLTPCLAYTMGYEGGFVNNPQDPGGPTNFGITLATLKQVRGSATIDDIRALTATEAEAIYQARYYLPVKADQVPVGVSLMLGDMAVNAGVDRAARIMQQALGVTVDGNVGPQTIQAANRQSVATTIVKMSVLQAAFYRGLETFPTFGTGWLNRVGDRTLAALSMAGLTMGAAA